MGVSWQVLTCCLHTQGLHPRWPHTCAICLAVAGTNVGFSAEIAANFPGALISNMRLWKTVAVLAALAASSSATITLPNLFASSMVLRADVPVLITGVEDNPAGVQP